MPDRQCSRGHHDKPRNGVCPACKRIAEEEHEEVVYVAESDVVVEDDRGATFHPGAEEA